MTTTITDLVARIEELDGEDVIFAKRDWTEDAEARIFRLTQDFGVPPEARALGFEYFLEVAVIRQVLEEFVAAPHTPLAERLRPVILYATFDC